MNFVPVLEKFSENYILWILQYYTLSEILHIDNMKARTFMISLQNWKNYCVKCVQIRSFF